MEIYHILDFIRDVSLALAGTLLCNSLSCLQATSLRPDCASTDFLSLVSVFHWKRLPRAVFRSDNHAFDAWILCSRWIAWSDLQLQVRNQRRLAVVSTVALLLIVVPSLIFDLAYGRAMQQKDAREIVRKDLQNAIGERPTRIGILHVGPDFYTVMPAAKPLNNEKVTVQLQDPGEDADFLLAGFPSEGAPALINSTVRQVETQGKF